MMLNKLAFALALGAVIGTASLAQAGGWAPARAGDDLDAALRQFVNDALKAEKRALKNLRAGKKPKWAAARRATVNSQTALQSAGGATDEASFQTSLSSAAKLDAEAIEAIDQLLARTARKKLQAAIKLKTAVLRAITPLAHNVTLVGEARGLHGGSFEDHTGVQVKADKPVSRIGLGADERVTTRAVLSVRALPITNVSNYFIISGTTLVSQGPCTLATGIIRCSLTQPMVPGQAFQVAFSPAVPAGTKLLIRAVGPDGEGHVRIVVQ